MSNQINEKAEKLIAKGVKIPRPDSIDISDDVDTGRISGEGTIIYPGSKIYGKSTLVMQGAKLGYEGPVTIEDCQVGPHVELKCGFFKKAVFLQKAIMGYGSHVREGTILEEEAHAAHTVALKQTILFPHVTLGSLINFCDCFMAGGTGKKDHSEVGSSFIHFNFTPNQDKATASLIGDVPNGVMLNQRPIFLGGQGGLVGPVRLAYGTITAAGTICRKDELKPGRLLLEGGRKSINIPFKPGSYQNVKRIVLNNIIYMGNLVALFHWYSNIRSQFISADFSDSLLEGLKEKLDMGITERLKRLKELAEKVDASKKGDSTNVLLTSWSQLESTVLDLRQAEHEKEIMDRFLESIYSGIKKNGKDYLQVIKSLNQNDAEIGTQWLQGIVDHTVTEVFKIISSYK